MLLTSRGQWYYHGHTTATIYKRLDHAELAGRVKGDAHVIESGREPALIASDPRSFS